MAKCSQARTPTRPISEQYISVALHVIGPEISNRTHSSSLHQLASKPSDKVQLLYQSLTADFTESQPLGSNSYCRQTQTQLQTVLGIAALLPVFLPEENAHFCRTWSRRRLRSRPFHHDDSYRPLILQSETQTKRHASKKRPRHAPYIRARCLRTCNHFQSHKTRSRRCNGSLTN